MLKIIIIIIGIFLILRFFSRFLLSLFISNLGNKISQAQNNMYNDRSRRKEGEVIINSSKKGDKKYDVNEGEYVDFEEIK